MTKYKKKYNKKSGRPLIDEFTINEIAEKITNELKTNLEAKKITIGDVKENVSMMRKAMPQIVSAMSNLLQEMKKSKNSTEFYFATELIKNKGLLSKFLTINSDGKMSYNDEKEVKRSDMQGGNGPDDNTALEPCEKMCRDLPALNAARQSIVELRREMQREGISAEERTNLQGQLNQAIMIGVMTEQRQQLLDALKNQQNWNKCRQVCNIASKFFFTGLSGFTALMILRLVSGAAGFITGTASGVVSLISVGILNIISGGVNTITENIPVVGSRVMGDGREVLEGFTSSVGNLTEGVPEVEQFITDLEDLGYTTNIIAFLILFAFFMIFFHLTRIVASADSASLSVPLIGGINVGNPGTGGQLLNHDELQILAVTCPPQPPRMLQGPDGRPSAVDGGGKKRRKRKTRKRRKTKRRKRKTKRKTKKRKRHSRKKKKSTR
jgi:ABC-type amino acid transport system permease subunit